MALWDRSKALAAFETFRLSGTNAALAVYWLSLWDGAAAPARAAFNPARVRELLPAIALCEMRGDGRAMCRLSGLYLDMAMGGPLRGADMLSLVGGAERQRRAARLSGLVGGGVALSRTRYVVGGRSFVAETLQLPFFGTAEDGARQYLSHCDWRPGAGDQYRREPHLRSGTPDEHLAVALV